MWINAGFLIMFFLGYVVGRTNRNNEIGRSRSVDNAIMWISKNGRTPEEKKKLVDFLIWIEDGEDMQEG